MYVASIDPDGTFMRKRSDILGSLSRPDTAYTDLSPRGRVDVEIRDLIDLINASSECVTTSSCAGRISVFLEGGTDNHKVSVVEADTSLNVTASVGIAKPSVKGSGGRWLFVSHQPLELVEHPNLHQTFGVMQPGPSSEEKQFRSNRFVHFKFEPMILHMLTASLDTARNILVAAQQAGFRESGISGATSACPMVAVRSSGIALESIIASVVEADGTSCNETSIVSVVSEQYLRMLVAIANARFVQNTERIARFREHFAKSSGAQSIVAANQAELKEDKDVRRLRKRAEGLRKRQEIHEQEKNRDLDGVKAPEYALDSEHHYLDNFDRVETILEGRI